MSTSTGQAKLGVVSWLLAAALAGCAGGEAPSPVPSILTAVTSTGPATDTPNPADYRHRNHGGVSRLIAVSLQELDLTADQRVVLEKLRDDVLAKMEPGRAAGTELANLLADGVAAGVVDHAKAELAIARVAEAGASLRQAMIDDLNRLHATLTPQQRKTLIEKMQARWAMWKDAQREAEQSGQGPPRDITVLAEKLGLSQDQVSRIEAGFTSAMQGVVLDYYPRQVEARMQAFASSFEGEAFDARTIPPHPGATGSPPASFGATRMARFFEAFAPVLTPDQRAKLAQDIRDHASRHDGP